MSEMRSEIQNLREAYQFVAEMLDDVRAAMLDISADLDRIEKSMKQAAGGER